MLRAVGVLSGFAVLLLTGEYVREGPVLVTLSMTHDIHRGDVGIVALWVLGVIGVLTCALSRPQGWSRRIIPVRQDARAESGRSGG